MSSSSRPSWPSEVDVRALVDVGPIHFMGVGGAGMCPLAEAMARHGANVTGCDTAPGMAVQSLVELGVDVRGGHDPSHVEDVACVVVSAAVPVDHPEVRAARDRGIPVIKRAKALGAWVSGGKVIAVAGTHGKTSTAAMVTEVLASGGLNPTGFVGGWVSDWRGHLRVGGDELFVVEADEYDRSFLHLRPTVAVVTNLEADHLDIYGDLDGVRAGFRSFLDGLQEGGTVVVCGDDPGASGLAVGLDAFVRTFGFGAGNQVRGTEPQRTDTGTRFRVLEDGVDRGWFSIPWHGLHNARNALAAIAVGRLMGIGWSDMRAVLSGFGGVKRRFQQLGEAGGIAVVDDYAHHPTELEAAVAAARDLHPTRRLVAVFQPHLFTRTRDFASEFGRVLARVDEVWVTEIYPAREPPIPGVDGALVVQKVKDAMEADHGARDVRLHQDLARLPEDLAESLRAGDLLLTLGAGTIEHVGPAVLEHLRHRAGGSGAPNVGGPHA